MLRSKTLAIIGMAVFVLAYVTHLVVKRPPVFHEIIMATGFGICIALLVVNLRHKPL